MRCFLYALLAASVASADTAPTLAMGPPRPEGTVEAPAPVAEPPAAPIVEKKPIEETPVPPAPAASAPAAAPAPVERWYRPQPGDPTAADAPQTQWATLLSAGLHLDRHAFLSTSFFRLGAVGGMFHGNATELRLRIGSPLVGVSLGLLVPGDEGFGVARSIYLESSSLYSLGLDADLLAGIPITDFGDALSLWLMTPSFEPRIFFRGDLSQMVIATGSTLAGLRLVWKDFAFDLRGPRVDLWMGPLNTAFILRASVGAALAATWVY